jgi:X-Pro dipeptidyl-peptidase
MVTLHLGAGGAARGALAMAVPSASGANVTEKFTDNVELSAPALAAAADSRNRLMYVTPELKNPVHLSGTVRVTIRLASSKAAANLSVYLVQIPWVEGPISTSNLITRGWADPQNYASLKNGGSYLSMEKGQPLKPGQFVTMTFDLQPDDRIIQWEAHRPVILSSDRDFRYGRRRTELAVDAATRIMLPVVSGDAWKKPAATEIAGAPSLTGEPSERE